MYNSAVICIILINTDSIYYLIILCADDVIIRSLTSFPPANQFNSGFADAIIIFSGLEDDYPT